MSEDFLIRRKKTWKEHLFFWGAIVLVLLLAISIALNVKRADTINEQQGLIEALNDTVFVWKDKQGRTHAKITTIQTAKTGTFTDINSSNPEIKELQELVEKYKSELKNRGTATIFKSVTVYDTIKVVDNSAIIKDAVEGKPFVLRDSIDNKWITAKWGFTDNTSEFSLETRDQYSVIIGEESQGWFKSKKPFAEVISENPYNELKSVRAYQVVIPKKRIQIRPGLYAGYGGTLIEGVVKTGVQIGGGIIITY